MTDFMIKSHYYTKQSLDVILDLFLFLFTKEVVIFDHKKNKF